MIAKHPDDRPNTNYIRAHPTFWSPQKMINFITEVSNIAQSGWEAKKNRCVRNFENSYFPKLINQRLTFLGWLGNLDKSVIRIFQEQKYDHYKHSAIKLVRLIRNLKGHIHDYSFPNTVNYLMGEGPDNFMTFWLRNFPTLINELRDSFTELADLKDLVQFYIFDPNVQNEQNHSVSRRFGSVAY